MRIAINAWFLNQPGTGSGQYLQGLLRAMPEAAAEHQFLFVSPLEGLQLRIPGLDIEFWSLRPIFRSRYLDKVLFEQIGFPRVCRRWGADLAHVPYWGSSLRPTVPTVVTVHDLGHRAFPDAHTPGQRRYLEWSTRYHVSAAAHLVADSEATKQDLVRLYGADEARVTVVHLGVDPGLKPVRDPAELARVRAKYGLGPAYVLYVGTLQPRKNLVRLIHAYAAAKVPHKLVLAGKQGWLAEPILTEINNQSSIVMPGFIEGHGHFTGLGRSKMILDLTAVANFDEISCLSGGLGRMPMVHLMAIALANAHRLTKFGA